MADNGRSALQIQEDEAEHRRQIEAQEAASSGLSDEEKAARIHAAITGYVRGVAPGFAEEGIRTGSNINDLTIAAARLASGPLDHLFSPPGQSAADQLGMAGLNLLGGALNYARHPSKIAADAGGLARRTATGLNPFTGYAPTVQQQSEQAFGAGKNAGKALFNAAGMTEGLGSAKLLSDFGYLSRGMTTEELLASGLPQKESNYFAALYRSGGQGSHFVPQRFKIFGNRLPDWLMDSPFNRILPAPDATMGQAARAHFIRDNKYWGGRVRAEYGGGGWSGKRLGWAKPPAPVRWWLGMPIPTRLAGLAGAVGLSSLADPGGHQ